MTRGIVPWLPALLALVGCSFFGGDDGGSDGGPRADASVPKPAHRAGSEIPPGVEAVGGLWLIEVEIPDFDKLAPESRLIAMYHARAARAGDAILYRQIGAELPRVRRLLLGVLRHDERVPGSIRDQLRRYAALFFANHGNRDARDGRKFVPRIIPGQLAAAANAALEQGADIGLGDVPDVDLGASKLEELEGLLALVRPWVFDRAVVQQVPSPDAGASGDKPSVPPADLKPLAVHLRSALELQQGAERERAGQLIAALEGGDGRSAASRGIAAAPGSAVRTLIGLVPDAADPREVSDPFGALVTVADPGPDSALRALELAARGLDRAVAEEVGAPKTVGRVDSVELHAVRAVAATGLYGPILPAGGGFPGAVADPVVRDPGGGALLLLTNVAEAVDRALGERVARAFTPGEEAAKRRGRWRGETRLALVALREIAGRGTDGTERRPREFLHNRLGEHRVVIDELRADLTALYLAFSPAARELGIVPDDECARALYDEYVSRALEQLVFLGPGAELEDPRMQAVQIAVRSLIQKGVVVEERKGGRLALRVADHAAMRTAVGELLAEVRGVRHAGNGLRAAELADGLGRTPPTGWPEAAQESWRRAGLPEAMGFVYPRLEAGDQGSARMADVEVRASESLLDAQISSAGAVNE